MSYHLHVPNSYLGANIMIVGCGGTGGFVAEGLCRLLVNNHDWNICLVDHDKVEESNLGRQNFYAEDLGKFKAEVLARRLANNYGCEIDFTVNCIEEIKINDRGKITIGCVDNPGARGQLQYATIPQTFYGNYNYHSYHNIGGWYIDAGNSEHSGQVLIGNSFLHELNRSFYPKELGNDNNGTCYRLPLPTVQQPGLLAPETKPVVPRDCAQRVAADEQSPVINQAMAALVLQFVSLLLKGELTWMGAYLDLQSGTLSTVPADPEIVSRMTGLTFRQLVYHPRPQKAENRVRVGV
jgi:PRTRC genetic system ThiF family protein